MAVNCGAPKDICGTCALQHCTTACMNGDNPRCVSCKMAGHASWDHSCPVFQQKCHELNERINDNNMPYFPTPETWTQVMEPPRMAQAQRPHAQAAPPPPADSPSRLSSGNEVCCVTTTETVPHHDTIEEHPSPYSTSPGTRRSTPTETIRPTPTNPSLNNTPHPVPNRLCIWQQNLNKSRVMQEELINSEVYKEYDLLILQEPYIDSYGNTKVTRDWRVTYPSSFLSRNHITRCYIP